MKIIKNKNKYFLCLQKQLYKFVVILIIISMFSSVLNTNQTFAYFTDLETIRENIFTAETLDIVTNSDLGIINLDSVQDYNILNQGSLPFEYSMTAEISSGSDITFCGQLSISVLKDVNILYTGSLSGLNFTKLIGGGQDNLTFTITDSGTNPAGKVCSFNLISKAWQDELDYSEGFTDKVYTKAVVYSANTTVPPISSGVVLNEFLPRPDGYEYGFDFGSDSSDMPKGEWVELYNNANIDADVTGWYLSDASNGNGNITPINSSHILVPSPIVPAHGWLVVYMNEAIYNNPGDTVKLFDSSNNLVDSYSYGIDPTYCDMEPTPDNNNNTNPSGSCDSSNVPGNKSFARIPDGVGSWVDPIPTPGASNELIDKTILEKTTEVIPAESIVTNEEKIPTDGSTISEEPVIIEEENGATIPEESDNEIKDEEIITIEDPIEGSEGGEIITEIPEALEPEEIITEKTEIIEETPASEVIEPEDSNEVVETTSIEDSVVVIEEPVIVEEEVIEVSAEVVEEPAVETAIISE